LITSVRFEAAFDRRVHGFTDTFCRGVVETGGFSLQSTLTRPEQAAAGQALPQENSAVKTKRLTQQSRFWLKEAMAQRGGSEAFLHWLRSDAVKHG
jgi:hypothetical protein